MIEQHMTNIQIIASTSVIQIGLAQAIIGICVVVLGAGIAWGTLKEAVKNIGTTVDEIKKDLKSLSKTVVVHKTEIVALKLHTKYGESHSPVRPNELGKKLLKDSGFDSQYPEMKERLFNIIDKLKPRTLYDYQTSAVKALEELMNDPVIDPLKEYSVNHPDEPLELIFDVASWIIRDDYATTNPVKTKKTK